jgi:hypothetical protein
LCYFLDGPNLSYGLAAGDAGVVHQHDHRPELPNHFVNLVADRHVGRDGDGLAIRSRSNQCGGHDT